jgi:IMP dehydrogenase
MTEYLTFDDVTIEPVFSTKASRYDDLEINTDTIIGYNNELSVPILSANMRTVTDRKMLNAMRESGGYGILHRGYDSVFDLCKELEQDPSIDSISVGLREVNEIDKLLDLIKKQVKVVCFDVANAANIHAFQAVKTLCEKINLDYTNVIVGNLCVPEHAIRYAELNIAGVKVGVGSGASCTTRLMTGVGIPQLSAIMNVSQALRAQRSRIAIIGDGGISKPADYTKAIMGGADMVMMGKVMAYALESPGWVNLPDPSQYMWSGGGQVQPINFVNRQSSIWEKSYTGESTFSEMRPPEGVSNKLQLNRVPPTVKQILEYYNHGLRSAMSYTDAGNLAEFRAKGKFARVSLASLREAQINGEAMLP